jgi:hypothetical protein
VAPAMPSPFGRSKSPEAEHSDELENEEDLDLALDIKKLTSEHKVILNKCATNYGMEFGDYIRILILEGEEKEKIKQNKLLEAEKAQYSVSYSLKLQLILFYSIYTQNSRAFLEFSTFILLFNSINKN